MISPFDHSSSLDDDDIIRMTDSLESVCDDDDGTSLEKSIESGRDLLLTDRKSVV